MTDAQTQWGFAMTCSDLRRSFADDPWYKAKKPPFPSSSLTAFPPLATSSSLLAPITAMIHFWILMPEEESIRNRRSAREREFVGQMWRSTDRKE